MNDHAFSAHSNAQLLDQLGTLVQELETRRSQTGSGQFLSTPQALETKALSGRLEQLAQEAALVDPAIPEPLLMADSILEHDKNKGTKS